MVGAVIGDVDLVVAEGDGAGERVAVGVEQVGDARERLPGGIERRGAGREFGPGPVRVGEFEGVRKVDLQAAELGVAVHPPGPEGRLGLEASDDRGRRGFVESVGARQQGEVLEGADARVDAARRRVLQAGEDFHAGTADATQGFLPGLIGGRRRIRAGIAEVEAGFDAFVANPVGVVAVGAGVGHGDARQSDPAIGFARHRGGLVHRSGGARVADQGHEVVRGRRIGIVPGSQQQSVVIGHVAQVDAEQ